jgi:hypothetical protein
VNHSFVNEMNGFINDRMAFISEMKAFIFVKHAFITEMKPLVKRDCLSSACGSTTFHNAAGGTATYADPITFATAPTEFSPGVRLYVPFIEKYVVMGDSCGQCTTDWSSSRKYHIDLWMNSNGTESATALTNCEGSRTRTQTEVETNPPPTRTVITAPLFDPRPIRAGRVRSGRGYRRGRRPSRGRRRGFGRGR